MKRTNSLLTASTAVITVFLTAGLATAASAAPVTHAASEALACHASVSNSRPRDYTDIYVKVATADGARITTVAHYKTKSTTHTGTANSKGDASIKYDISGATPGYRVVVSVKATSGKRSGSCSTSFTPYR